MFGQRVAQDEHARGHGVQVQKSQFGVRFNGGRGGASVDAVHVRPDYVATADQRGHAAGSVTVVRAIPAGRVVAAAAALAGPDGQFERDQWKIVIIRRHDDNDAQGDQTVALHVALHAHFL